MTEKPKRKQASKKIQSQSEIKKDDLVKIFKYALSPGKSQAKTFSKALICSSFVGVSVADLPLVKTVEDQEWYFLGESKLLPQSESAILELMSESETNGDVSWQDEDLTQIPPEVSSALRIDNNFDKFLSTTIKELASVGEINSYRARHKIKQETGVEVNEQMFVDAFVKRINNAFAEKPVIASLLTKHCGALAPQDNSVLNALESFCL